MLLYNVHATYAHKEEFLLLGDGMIYCCISSKLLTIIFSYREKVKHKEMNDKATLLLQAKDEELSALKKVSNKHCYLPGNEGNYGQ